MCTFVHGVSVGCFHRGKGKALGLSVSSEIARVDVQRHLSFNSRALSAVLHTVRLYLRQDGIVRRRHPQGGTSLRKQREASGSFPQGWGSSKTAQVGAAHRPGEGRLSLPTVFPAGSFW